MFFRRKYFVCSVCGYPRLPGPLYNEKGIPDVNLICSCCGFQPGYDDFELGYSIESYRNEWIENEAVWFDEKKKPKKWDIQNQFMNLKKSL